MFSVQLQIPIVNDILCFIKQVRHKLPHWSPWTNRVNKTDRKRAQHIARHLEVLRCHWVIVMQVMKVSRILDITLKYVVYVEPAHLLVI